MQHIKKTVFSLSLIAASLFTHTAQARTENTDVLLIGGGIMSASLGTWLHELQPEWKQTIG